jgi:RimJ/RimL family protein N-acetyltransferase
MGWIHNLSDDAIPQLLQQLSRQPHQLSAVSERGPALVDGEGASRLAQVLTDPPLTLRHAQPEDSRTLWEWRNEETVRMASFSTDIIPWENHQRWFASRVHSDDCQILIAADQSGTPIGQVRFDFSGRQAEIGISIDKPLRSAGYGTALIRAATNWAFVHRQIESVDAWIREENKASQAAFQKAEYTPDQSASSESHPGLHFVSYNHQARLRAA